MKLDIGDGPPVEFECGASGVKFGWGSIDRAEDIELVMPKIYWSRVVGLKWRTRLRPQL